jgi:hypothetical protein
MMLMAFMANVTSAGKTVKTTESFSTLLDAPNAAAAPAAQPEEKPEE